MLSCAFAQTLDTECRCEGGRIERAANRYLLEIKATEVVTNFHLWSVIESKVRLDKKMQRKRLHEHQDPASLSQSILLPIMA